MDSLWSPGLELAKSVLPPECWDGSVGCHSQPGKAGMFVFKDISSPKEGSAFTEHLGSFSVVTIRHYDHSTF